MGIARAHLAYIERETAVEKIRPPRERGRERELDVELLLDGPALDLPRRRGRPSLEDLKAREMVEPARDAALARNAGREVEGGRERDPADIAPTLEGPGKGAAAQTYIEDPTKLRNGEVVLSSFGTIGETYEERLRFWGLVEEHEPAPDARIQNRLICELPHQSTPEARREILQRFVRIFDEKEIPYHVAVHAPGKGNDARNFHAHIVFLERPAKRIVDPTTGELEWDFAIITTYKKRISGNVKTSHPHRRSRDRDLNKQTFVADMRRTFAASVNAVMATVDPEVKFDPRSYKDMGLAVDPMESVYRVSQNRLNKGKLVVQDVAWTKRMVAQKMREAALRRDPDMLEFFETTKALEALKQAWPNVPRMNSRLGPGAQIVNLAAFTKRTFTQLIDRRLALENHRAQDALVSRAELSVCKSVMEATRPRTLPTRKKDARTAEEQEELRLLFKTAREEHEGVKSRMHAEAFRLNALIAANKDAWCATAKALVAAPARVSAPEKPDTATGRALFEPESAAAAKAAHRRTEPAPKAAGTASCAIPLPLAGRTPTRAAPEKSTGILSPAQKELSQQRPPHVGTQMSAEAFVAMQKSMEASVRRFVDQIIGFDKGAFWKAARQDAPLSAAAIVKTESLMGVPGGTFSITPHQPDEQVRTSEPVRDPAPKGFTSTDRTVVLADVHPAVAIAEPKVAKYPDTPTATVTPADTRAAATVPVEMPSRPVPEWDMAFKRGQQAPTEAKILRETLSTPDVPSFVQNPPATAERRAGDNAGVTEPKVAKYPVTPTATIAPADTRAATTVPVEAPSRPVPDWDMGPQQAHTQAEITRETRPTLDVPLSVQKPPDKGVRRADAGATPSKPTKSPATRRADFFATIFEGEVESTLSGSKPLRREPSVKTIYPAKLARGDKSIVEDEGLVPMAATAATKPKPAPDVTRVSEQPAAPVAHISEHQDSDEERKEQKRKKKAQGRRAPHRDAAASRWDRTLISPRRAVLIASRLKPTNAVSERDPRGR